MTSPILLDDSDLIRIASTQRTRLFQILSRVRAFAPLIIVCSILPSLVLLTSPALDEEGALWGLRNLAVANTISIDSAIEAGINEPGQPLVSQPPLAAWLNGLVIKIAGPTSPLATTLIPVLATGFAVWLITRLASRIGGANTALVAALFMCCQADILEMATEPDNSSVGLALLLVSMLTFQRHLEGRPASFSSSLIVSGIAWGLSVLAIGPVALTIPIVFVIHAIIPKPEHRFVADSSISQKPMSQGRSTLIAAVYIVGLGIILAGWWCLLMLTTIGTDFLYSWGLSLPLECIRKDSPQWQCELRPYLQPTWKSLLIEQSLILPWLLVGLERSWYQCRHSTNQLTWWRFRLLLIWWTVALVGRVATEMLGTVIPTNTHVWNLVLLGPTILLSSVGVSAMIDRTLSQRKEFALIVVLVTLISARVGSSWMIGLAGGAFTAAFLVIAPLLIPTVSESGTEWSKKGWRQFLQIAICVSLLSCLFVGFDFRPSTPEQDQLVDLRERFKTLPTVQRISVVATRDPVPVTLKHLLRSQWPQADLVVSEGWDTGLTKLMNEEAADPHSRFLVIEWTRRDVRLFAETTQDWKASIAGDPMEFFDRKLSLVLVEPRLTSK